MKKTFGDVCSMEFILFVVYFFVYYYYRPQRSWGKFIFSQASVILFRGGVYASVPPPRLGNRPPPPVPGTPQYQAPPRSSACWEIRSTSGRYASCWNAILL